MRTPPQLWNEWYETRVGANGQKGGAECCRGAATQLQALTGQHIAIRDGKAVITDTAA